MFVGRARHLLARRPSRRAKNAHDAPPVEGEACPSRHRQIGTPLSRWTPTRYQARPSCRSAVDVRCVLIANPPRALGAPSTALAVAQGTSPALKAASNRRGAIPSRGRIPRPPCRRRAMQSRAAAIAETRPPREAMVSQWPGGESPGNRAITGRAPPPREAITARPRSDRRPLDRPARRRGPACLRASTLPGPRPRKESPRRMASALDGGGGGPLGWQPRAYPMGAVFPNVRCGIFRGVISNNSRCPAISNN